MPKNKKRPVLVFISSARANRALVGRFLKHFKEQVGASINFVYQFWSDSDLLVGDSWHDEIQRALEKCDLGLLLISPAFLGSQYIDENELPKFVGGQPKPVLPVMLQPVVPGLHDLKGLKKKQLFRLESDSFKKPKSFGDCSGPNRDRFALELFRQTEARLMKSVKSGPSG
jgi:hypothetical protein